jgi:MoaA/NifB/PqqE/SkfB family radical SAM enzyme
LYRHDREWLNANSPSLLPPKKYSEKRVNWHERDMLLSSLIPEAAEKIKNYDGKPVRISVNAIGKYTGQLVILQKHLTKLPLSRDALEKVIESKEDFQLRRVLKVVRMLKKRNEIPVKWKLIRLAGLKPGYSDLVSTQIDQMFRGEINWLM